VPEADQTDQYPVVSSRAPHTSAALPSFVEASLEIMSGPEPRSPFLLAMVETVIGRAPAADVRLQDMMMSKKHASLVYADGEFRIRDEKSSNGTFLNGSKVVEYAIRDGDKLLIGDTLFRFRVGRAK
jgi:predicted component of type VI protein secretion system